MNLFVKKWTHLVRFMGLLCCCSSTLPFHWKIPKHGPTMRGCLLVDSSPVPYPVPRAPIAPLCVCAAPMRLCMSLCPLAIPVDGPTAWLRSTWMASSKRSRRSSIRLCCRASDMDRDEKPTVFAQFVNTPALNINSEVSGISAKLHKGCADYEWYHWVAFK